MNSQSSSPTEVGFRGGLNWLLGGSIGGFVGALIFGGLLWLVDPTIVTETIPATYGMGPGTVIGWTFHIVLGVILGVVFGFLMTRDVILGTIATDVATDAIAGMGYGLRITLAGLVYGLAVWSILPIIVRPIWISVGGVGEPGFPATAIEILVGHLIFGLILGALFSVFVEIAPEANETESPFEEPPESRPE